MTFNSPPDGRTDRASHDERASARRRRRARGFTLTELIVVIGIIVLVLSIATPMIARAWRQGDRVRTAADLQAIATALEAYRQDHGDYPEVAPPPTPGVTGFDGARTLCRALIGQLDTDGIAGPGFRKRQSPGSDGRPGTADDVYGGRNYGPYLAADKFRLDDPLPKPGEPSTNLAGYAMLDRYNRPILYYRAVGRPNIRLARGFFGVAADKSLYNADDNLAIKRVDLAPVLGDINANGMIDGNESPAHEGPYILWSAGPDETFGAQASAAPPVTGPVDAKDVAKCDDITNFRQ